MATDITSRAKATLSIEIVDSCKSDDRSISIELDADLNHDKTCFVPGERVYLRVYTEPQDVNYLIKNTYGVVIANPGGDGLSEHEDEYVEIVDGTGSLSRPLNAIQSIAWHGTAPCPLATVAYSVGQKTIHCSDGACTLSPDNQLETGICDVTYGVLKITYNSLYKSYYAIANEAGKILVYAFELLDGDVLNV